MGRLGYGPKTSERTVCLAGKPLIGTVAENVLEHGTGALNIDGCRVGEFVNMTPPGTDRYNAANFEQGYRPSAYGPDGEASADRRYTEKGSTNFAAKPGPRGGSPAGRWPANVILDDSEEVRSCFPHTKSGVLKGGTPKSELDPENETGG
jgi:site-specific DNA-methyltransferase (adenine-specific)